MTSLADEIRRWITTLPDIENWPIVQAVITDKFDIPRLDWDLPWLAYQVVGGTGGYNDSGWVPLAFLQVSIILIDDILDNEPEGYQARYGAGVVANTAAAIQALAYRVLERSTLAPGIRLRISQELTDLVIDTAHGQHLDVLNLSGEDNYWRVVEAKSTPFYRASFAIGALAGGGNDAQVAALGEIGTLIGEIVQIIDDEQDAMAIPANPDWLEARNNLLIMYALAAEYPEKEQFVALRARAATDERALAQAQALLVRSGAASYALYNSVARFQVIMRLLRDLDVPNPQPMHDFIRQFAHDVLAILNKTGVAISAETLLTISDDD